MNDIEKQIISLDNRLYCNKEKKKISVCFKQPHYADQYILFRGKKVNIPFKPHVKLREYDLKLWNDVSEILDDVLTLIKNYE